MWEETRVNGDGTFQGARLTASIGLGVKTPEEGASSAAPWWAGLDTGRGVLQGTEFNSISM